MSTGSKTKSVARIIDYYEDESYERNDRCDWHQVKGGEVTAIPEALRNRDLRVGDIIRLDEYRDVETCIVDSEGRLFRDMDADYYIRIPLIITQHFPNAIAHYASLLEDEEQADHSPIVSIQLSYQDEWLTERFGPLPSLEVWTEWLEGELESLTIDGIEFDGDMIEDLTLAEIQAALIAREEPQCGFLLWYNINGDGVAQWCAEKKARRTKIKNLMRKYNWHHESMPSQGYISTEVGNEASRHESFWGPENKVSEILREVKELYSPTKFTIEGPRNAVKIKATGWQNRGGKGFTLNYYWVPTDIEDIPIAHHTSSESLEWA